MGRVMGSLANLTGWDLEAPASTRLIAKVCVGSDNSKTLCLKAKADNAYLSVENLKTGVEQIN